VTGRYRPRWKQALGLLVELKKRNGYGEKVYNTTSQDL
jgi:hypothetical protein